MSSHSSPPVSLYDLTFDQLLGTLVGDGLRPAHATTLWRALYRELDPAPNLRADFLGPLRRWLQERWEAPYTLTKADITTCISSSDGLTRKLLLRLHDAQEVETVLMGYPGRFTACLSTQAGCAMGCVFCATGQMGFVRHLTPGEIVAQLIAVQRLLRESASRISVSTVGVVPGIVRFTDERLPYSLAISLHAATDEERSALLPVNQRWPLSELIAACRYYMERSGAKIFFGWTLIAGRNDTPEQAQRLSELLRGLNAHVNLIRLNATAGFSGVTTEDVAAAAFQKRIQDAGIPCTIR
ncbi:MAG: 23S rRNA (adenine(2503)-C(2))-methyltransferase RlmN, partial [Proteobacteria bacterium]|nr:23S rRNA (adenine(2503)-C(2))-methyltransferase RlmN [Pseudomonadota bacterium]